MINVPPWLQDTKMLPSEGLRLVYIDGSYCAALSSVHKLKEGGIELSLDRETGCTIALPAATKMLEPLSLLHYSSTEGRTRNEALRITLQLGAGAELTCTSSSFGESAESSYRNALAWNFVLARGAKAQFFQQQCESKGATYRATVEVTQERDSSFRTYQLSLGAAYSQVNFVCTQQGRHAESEIVSLMLAEGSQQSSMVTTLVHQAKEGRSDQYHKVVLADKARGTFHGCIKIADHADKTNANLLNKNLLLDQGCEIDTRPQLEIDTDEVRCSHGATVSQLHPEELFYLQSRGIPAAQARTMLSHAYIAEFLQHLPEGAQRQQWTGLVERYDTQKVQPL